MTFVHTYSVSGCKRSNTASNHLVTSQVITLRNIAEDGKYYLFALVKISLAHCRFSPTDSESHRQNEECWQVQTKTLRSKKVDDSLVDEVEHVLLLVDFCR